eukprot:Em0551g9a
MRHIPQLEDVSAVKAAFNRHLHQTVVKDRHVATTLDFYKTIAHTVRDQMVGKWIRTQQHYYTEDPKRVYYLSMEYLMGRSLTNAMVNLGIDSEIEEALYELGLDLEELQEGKKMLVWEMVDLEGLAGCFPGLDGNTWDVCLWLTVFVMNLVESSQMSGSSLATAGSLGRPEYNHPHQVVLAMAYDYPIPGYNNSTVNTMRLWAAKSAKGFDLSYWLFLIVPMLRNISRVLYPNDNQLEGKELRLKQEYLMAVLEKWPNDIDRMRRLSIVEEVPEKRINMAYLAVVGSHAVNGVAAITHSCSSRPCTCSSQLYFK